MNSLFDILELDARMVGLNPEGGKLPLFKNSVGKVFDINYLSSGEKQLFARGMALRMLNAVNSVILIDEPEISMHPGWQQKIVKVYRQLANNSQIIIATHSPHIVASVSKESVKLLKREKGRIKIVDSKDINGSYGLPVDVVLKELMELKSLRTPDVDAEIKTLWDLLHREQYLTEEFKQQYLKLEKLLGSEDEELLLMRIEIAKLEAQKGKPNVGSGVIS
ncbi:MAG: ATP-binding protein [bacterium]|nr:ATP-binding protein [bacterium]